MTVLDIRETAQQPAYLVFSDVDETLIRCKSMFDFLRFRLIHQYGQAAGTARYAELDQQFQQLAASGATREDVNRSYYRHYAGEDPAEITELGRLWFAERSADPRFFIDSTVGSLRCHQATGAQIALVSGSFAPCVDPIARHIGAAHVLATTPLVRAGRYTGEVAEPVIGDGKRNAVRGLLDSFPAVDPLTCYAYGDHPSDVPMLQCVGHPRVVGHDPSLLARFGPLAVPGHAVARWSMGDAPDEC